MKGPFSGRITAIVSAKSRRIRAQVPRMGVEEPSRYVSISIMKQGGYRFLGVILRATPLYFFTVSVLGLYEYRIVDLVER